tara:strand:- start:672 stop:863 length:192 start_codon:yes stop_codon:yes gene_type:complete
MTVRTTGDTLAAGGGAATSVWNFVLGGQLNVLIAALVGLLSLAVLIQRYAINRRELRRESDAD